MSILLSNDCSDYHIGSKLTTKVLKNLLSKHDKVWTSKTGNPSKHNLVVINGEGSFHDDNSNSKVIYETALKARNSNIPVCLINSVIDNISFDLSIFNYISARDSISADNKYPFTLDPCFYEEVRESPEGEYVLFVDSVIPDKSKQIFNAYKSYRGPKKYIKMVDYHSRKVFEIFSKSSFIISGRYHGVVFAIMHKKPFVALESNTHKIKGLLLDLGLLGNLIEEISDVKSVIHSNKPRINRTDIKLNLERMVSACIIHI